MMTPAKVRPKVQPWVGSVPAEGSTVFLEASLPTMARMDMIGMKRPIQMTIPVATL